MNAHAWARSASAEMVGDGEDDDAAGGLPSSVDVGRIITTSWVVRPRWGSSRLKVASKSNTSRAGPAPAAATADIDEEDEGEAGKVEESEAAMEAL